MKMADVIEAAFDRQWIVAFVVTALLLVLAEVGYRLGRHRHTVSGEARRNQVGIVQNSVLTLLGLLLGFTFSMAVARYDSRRELVVKEANAIGTTWLRANLLPDAHRQAVRDLLGEYVDLRLRTQAAIGDEQVVAEGLRHGAEIQSRAWQHAEAAAREAPSAITATFVTTLNELIDTDAERTAASRNRIPAGVLVVLVVVAAVGCSISAYASGSYGARSSFTSALLPLLISIVFLLIFDLTHEHQGFIVVSQQPMVELQRSIRPGSRTLDR
jgi:hypothetical protein